MLSCLALYRMKTSKLFLIKCLISVIHDRLKEFGGNSHAEIKPLWWLRIFRNFNQMVKHVKNRRSKDLDQSPAFVHITFKQLPVKVPWLNTAAQNNIKTTTSSSIDHPVQYTVNFFLLKKIKYLPMRLFYILRK
jgi:hypothetical protein